MSLSGSNSDIATYSPFHIRSATFGQIGGVDDANTTGAVVPCSCAMAGIGVANGPYSGWVLIRDTSNFSPYFQVALNCS